VTDECLYGGTGKGCGGLTAPIGKQIVFSTFLVGFRSDGTYGKLYEFDWETNFNGTSGGISTLVNLSPIDEGSGYGGVTLLGEQYLLEASVPEPSTWAMMILGFAGIGFMAYRRSKPALK
jgi:hypothetical protein